MSCRKSYPWAAASEFWTTGLVSGSRKACKRCSSGRLSQTVDGRSLMSATAVAGLPPLLLPVGALMGLLGGLWPLLVPAVEEEAEVGSDVWRLMESWRLGVTPGDLIPTPPAHITGQTCMHLSELLRRHIQAA